MVARQQQAMLTTWVYTICVPWPEATALGERQLTGRSQSYSRLAYTAALSAKQFCRMCNDAGFTISCHRSAELMYLNQSRRVFGHTAPLPLI